MTKTKWMFFASTLFITATLFSSSALSQDAKAAYEAGYRQGFIDGKNGGGGGTNDIKPGDTMVVIPPSRGGGSKFQEMHDKFFMVFNGSTWTGFSQPKTGNAGDIFPNKFNYESLKIGEKTGAVWSMEPTESVASQMKRLMKQTGKPSNQWLELFGSKSPELVTPGLKRYDRIAPLFPKE